MKKILTLVFSMVFLLALASCQGGNRKDYATFNYGKYPQTKISDKELIKKLDEITETNENGYYVYENIEYAKMKANPSYGDYAFADGTYILNKDYYFRVDDIKWRVLKTEGNVKYLISDYVIECTDYLANNDSSEYSYISSNIRSFLINDFYNKAFKNETAKPLLTEISIEIDEEITKINDRIWIPSIYEIEDKNNGFLSIDDRFAFTTDYAVAKGIEMYIDSPNSYFYRAAQYATSTRVLSEDDSFYYIDYFGKNMSSFDTRNKVLKNIGVRPCIRIEIEN